MAYQPSPVNPGIQAGGQEGMPGMLSMRQPGAMATRNIYKLMGHGYLLMGQELMKDRPDAAQLARAKSMILQANQAKLGMIQAQGQPGETNLTPQTGRPRPVDGAMDPLTGASGGGGMRYGAELP